MLTHQLSLSLEETEPLKKAKADLESVVHEKNTDIEHLQDRLRASESLCRQYQAFRKNSLDFDSERKAIGKKLQQLESSNKKLEHTVTNQKNEIRTCKFESTKSNNLIKSLELKLNKTVGKLEVYWDILKENGLVPKGDKRPSQANIVDVDTPYEGVFPRSGRRRHRSRVIDTEEDSMQEVPFRRIEKSTRQSVSSESPPLNPTQEEGTLIEKNRKQTTESPLPNDSINDVNDDDNNDDDDDDDFDAVSISSEHSFKFTMSPMVQMLSPLPPSPARLQNASDESSSENDDEDTEIVTAFNNDYPSDEANDTSTPELDPCLETADNNLFDPIQSTPIKSPVQNEAANQNIINTIHSSFKLQEEKELCAKRFDCTDGDIDMNADLGLSSVLVSEKENISKSSTEEERLFTVHENENVCLSNIKKGKLSLGKNCVGSSNVNKSNSISEMNRHNSNTADVENDIGSKVEDECSSKNASTMFQQSLENNASGTKKEENTTKLKSTNPNIDDEDSSLSFVFESTNKNNETTAKSENTLDSKSVDSTNEVKVCSKKETKLGMMFNDYEKNIENNADLNNRAEGMFEDSVDSANVQLSDKDSEDTTGSRTKTIILPNIIMMI
ncbi:TNF receptor-associated factor family protein DDB_G0272098-like [Gigantopelta aegis]|uniref:TNF receptor-associated factor family protein DDB_G0272098-like n=1 Tax=Gigantopelta aegis TaxID=1735272 RepID=UPI001B889324|nr:TNF receptor-associated factor family protein DDB_G0272098-like [Gigantopelta aegis]